MIDYGFVKKADTDFENAVESVTKALEKAGFGVLTTINVKEKFKQKLGIDFDNYIILGACKPAKGHPGRTEHRFDATLQCHRL